MDTPLNRDHDIEASIEFVERTRKAQIGIYGSILSIQVPVFRGVHYFDIPIEHITVSRKRHFKGDRLIKALALPCMSCHKTRSFPFGLASDSGKTSKQSFTRFRAVPP